MQGRDFFLISVLWSELCYLGNVGPPSVFLVKIPKIYNASHVTMARLTVASPIADKLYVSEANI
jgi:hypothetical protein